MFESSWKSFIGRHKNDSIYPILSKGRRNLSSELECNYRLEILDRPLLLIRTSTFRDRSINISANKDVLALQIASDSITVSANQRSEDAFVVHHSL